MELANQPDTAQASASLDSVPDPDTVFGPVQQESVNDDSEQDAIIVRSEAEVSDGDAEPLEEESRDQAPRPDIAESSQDMSSDQTEAVIEPVAPPPPAIPGAVLAVRLGNQDALRRLARPRLLSLLERYREHVSQAAEIYQGRLQTLHDGTSLISFTDNAGKNDAEELTKVLSCGELLRVLGHDLQIEIADTGIALHLQLAACRTENIDELEDDAYTEQPDCKQMLERLQFSRNLVLLDASLASTGILGQRAVVRRLASQSGVYCVERLKEPHQTLLERQLNALYTQRRN